MRCRRCGVRFCRVQRAGADCPKVLEKPTGDNVQRYYLTLRRHCVDAKAVSSGPHPPMDVFTDMATKKIGTSLQAINAQIAALQAKAEAIRKQEVGEVVAKIKDAIAHYGLTAADLVYRQRPRRHPRRPRLASPVANRAARQAPRRRASLYALRSTRTVKAALGPAWASGLIGSRLRWLQASRLKNC